MSFPDSTKKAPNVFFNTIDETGELVIKEEIITNFILPRKCVPSYFITMDVLSLFEGATATGTVNTSMVRDGTVLYWTAHGTATAADFLDGAMSGSVTINNGTGEIIRATKTDAFDDSGETFYLVLRTGSSSGPKVALGETVTILDSGAQDFTSLLYPLLLTESFTVDTSVIRGLLWNHPSDELTTAVASLQSGVLTVTIAYKTYNNYTDELLTSVASLQSGALIVTIVYKTYDASAFTVDTTTSPIPAVLTGSLEVVIEYITYSNWATEATSSQIPSILSGTLV